MMTLRIKHQYCRSDLQRLIYDPVQPNSSRKRISHLFVVYSPEK